MTNDYQLEYATAPDGFRLGWERWGQGTPLVLLHGGGRSAKRYRALAKLLADASFNVIVPDRRGRGHSPGVPTSDAAVTVADIGLILETTRAKRIFGHSAGAVAALDAALRLPLTEVAVYEPPILGELSPPMDWFPKFEAALAAGQTGRAFALMAKGLQVGLPEWIPNGVLSAGAWLGGMTRGKEGAEMLEELRTVPAEFVSARARKAQDYASLTMRLLFMDGSETPEYLRNAVKRLLEVLPRAQHRTFQGHGHNAPDVSDIPGVARVLAEFFSRD